jgi:hypothetical protein
MAGSISETRDISCISGHRADMPIVTGHIALMHRLARALQTDRGRFPFPAWRNRGTNMRQFLLSKVPPWRIARAASAECELDEQVESAEARVDVLDGGRRIRTNITVTTAEGTFAFTMTMAEAAQTLVELQRST